MPAEAAKAAEAVAAHYAVAISPEMAALINPDDPGDPIALQFIPDPRELFTLTEESPDPLHDAAFSPVPGIVHRYADRVLLKALHACPVYCRFCFRRAVVGPGGESLDAEALARAIAYIASQPSIFEVVLTGGDPFMLSARRVRDLTERLSAIPHVQVLRWHTRVPVVSPSRVSDAFAQALGSEKAVFVAVHANHPREFTQAAGEALKRLRAAGVGLVSQSVLLKGVNDDVETLDALMRAFLRHQVKPYYLHQGDLAPGTSHLRTTIDEGRALITALRARISGLAMPAYVLDDGGVLSKQPL